MKKYRFKTEQEFKDTCEKTSEGSYITGDDCFTKEMFYLFGLNYDGSPDNLVSVDGWVIEANMLIEVIEEPKISDMPNITYPRNGDIIDINGIQTEPFTHEEKKVIAVEKDIFKLEIWNLLLERFKLANDLQRIAILEIFEETGYPESDMVKLYQRLANDTN